MSRHAHIDTGEYHWALVALLILSCFGAGAFAFGTHPAPVEKTSKSQYAVEIPSTWSPNGRVRMSTNDAVAFADRMLVVHAQHAAANPRELPYIREQASTLLENIHDPKTVVIRFVSTYGPFPAVRATTQAFAERPELALVEFYVPFWVEYANQRGSDVGSHFLEVVAHELEHVRLGFWRPDRDHAPEEGDLDEAKAWGATCARYVLPLVAQGRLAPRDLCDLYTRGGSRPEESSFLRLIRTSRGR